MLPPEREADRPKHELAQGLAGRLVELALRSVDPAALVSGLAEQLRAQGVGLGRLWVGADILHPTVGARTVSWAVGRGVEATGFSRAERRDLDSPLWRATPLRVVLGERLPEFRRLLIGPTYRPGEFAMLDELRSRGLTDYLACSVPYPPGSVVGDTAGMVATFASDGPGGFSETELALLRASVPPLALAWRSILLLDALRSVAGAYLGAGPADQVLAGRIARGEVETIRAAIWFSDLEGFTALADTLPRDRLVALLNAYAGVVLDTIAGHGGEVLKLMGDGVLAIFPIEGRETDACARALDAARATLDAVERLSAERRAAGEPVTRLFVGLHLGDVLYGNIGSRERLDFTVLGPAVNEASRLERLCRVLGRAALVSESFAAAAMGLRDRLVPLGRHTLRGVARQQELYGLAQGSAAGSQALG
ncbi:MAG: adenylate/guanylate cyclase domain-containing protein [Geminicoccaceae bacterium]|nr:adenylate/guanylate cyclase domain-containing protein [Geminicoccaceae bacterium]MCX8100495.1 adenylate/guanylate cyclase domain-containing protein [Geminicoccaceae bacterium]MDW8370872.1 adenylate/guanylate cyclase domain-containing protein [Geminicoccaceae bacterium]